MKGPSSGDVGDMVSKDETGDTRLSGESIESVSGIESDDSELFLLMGTVCPGKSNIPWNISLF